MRSPDFLYGAHIDYRINGESVSVTQTDLNNLGIAVHANYIRGCIVDSNGSLIGLAAEDQKTWHFNGKVAVTISGTRRLGIDFG